MTFIAKPIFPGMLYDAAARLSHDYSDNTTDSDEDIIATMGWPSVLIAEKYGGSDGTIEDLAAIVEGLAPRGIRLPVVERCAIAPILLHAAAGDDQNERWLCRLADGTARIAPLVGSSPGLSRTRLVATPSATGFRLDGIVEGVAVAASATHYVLLATIPGNDQGATRAALFVVGADALPEPLRRYQTIDGCYTTDFAFRSFAADAKDCIAVGKPVDRAIQYAEDVALVITCVDSVATLGALIEQTIAYLNGRVQFGVQLSTFQVLRHRLVDMYVRYESARGMVEQCVRAGGLNRSTHLRNLSLMKLCVGETGRFSAETAIQLHGGMGMCEEVLAARLAQRLLASEFRYGDRLFHSTALSTRPAGATA